MRNQDYQVPQPSFLPTKKNQLQSMSLRWSMAGQAVRKVKQVQASVTAMISNQITGIKAAGHHLQRTPVYSYNPLSRTEDTIAYFKNSSHLTVWTSHVIQRTKLSILHIPLDFVVATDVQDIITSRTTRLSGSQRVIRNFIGIYIAINRIIFQE